MAGSISQALLQEIVLDSFRGEVNALKPGNVSRYADGHDMVLNDFIRSAELVTPVLCNKTMTLGERILESVTLTMREVGCNTNLGMIMLYAPLIKAVQEMNKPNINRLQEEVKLHLEKTDYTDADLVFQAIRTANPGGLGHSASYDVHTSPRCTLGQAMAAARDRDSVANQYVTGFQDVFHAARFSIKKYHRRWKSVEWATVACYLYFLSRMPDSHIARKYGNAVAEQTKEKAIKVAMQYEKYDNPAQATDFLLEFDKELKNSNINPGTSADLTAASLLVFGLQRI